MSTQDQIAALKAHEDTLKEPLKKQYHVLDAQIAALREPERAKQAHRDANIDNLSKAADQALVAEIRAARAAAEAAGVLALEAERKQIFNALKTSRGKARLGSPS